MSGWYIVCRKCGASVFISRWKIFARIDFWWMRLLDDSGTFDSCDDSPEEGVVTLQYKEAK